jgi:hypothetical protein
MTQSSILMNCSMNWVFELIYLYNTFLICVFLFVVLLSVVVVYSIIDELLRKTDKFDED